MYCRVDWGSQSARDPERDIHSEYLYRVWFEKASFVDQALRANPLQVDLWVDLKYRVLCGLIMAGAGRARAGRPQQGRGQEGAPVHQHGPRRLCRRQKQPYDYAAEAEYDVFLSTGVAYSTTAAALHPCVLIRTYSGNRNGIVSLLWSLLLSGHPNLRAIVVDTGTTPVPGLPGILHSINALSGKDWVEMSRRTFAQDVTPQFPGLDVEDYG